METTITGRVTSINIKGRGQNSAQFVFTVKAKDKKEEAIMVSTAYEPQIFASMVSFVTAAYFAGCEISAGYESVPTIDGGENQAIEVYTP